MADRELYYGDPDTESPRYRVRDTDPTNGGDYVVERLDANGNVVDDPLRIDNTAGVVDLSALPVSVGTFNGADIANAPAETVPVAQGDGTLAMSDAGLSIEVYADGSELPGYADGTSLPTEPTIAYLESEDDYVAPFIQ